VAELAKSIFFDFLWISAEKPFFKQPELIMIIGLKMIRPAYQAAFN